MNQDGSNSLAKELGKRILNTTLPEITHPKIINIFKKKTRILSKISHPKMTLPKNEGGRPKLF
jgi:hypothetical protein